MFHLSIVPSPLTWKTEGRSFDKESFPEAQSFTLKFVLVNLTSSSTLSCKNVDACDYWLGSQITKVSLASVMFWLRLSMDHPNLCSYVTRWHFSFIMNTIHGTSKSHTLPGTPTRAHCIIQKIKTDSVLLAYKAMLIVMVLLSGESVMWPDKRYHAFPTKCARATHSKCKKQTVLEIWPSNAGTRWLVLTLCIGL